MESTRFSLLGWAALIVALGLGCSEAEPGASTGSPGSEDIAADPATPSDVWGSWAARPDGPSLHDFVVETARRRAAQTYVAPDTAAARAVATLTYGQQRAIRFRDDRSLWSGDGGFQLQFFHPKGGFRVPVAIHLVEADSARAFPFDPGLFTTGNELEGVDLDLPETAGFAGFRVLAPLNDADRVDEIVSFLGASYFRLLGPGHVYGLSSRGLAVDVASPDGEEFPDFRAFWIVRPAPSSPTLTFFGLLDGPSVVGAYRFDLTPGRPDGSTQTTMDVDARLFARSAVSTLGVAPLTSMYLHGTFRRGGDDDVRPRVHDSEGLSMASGGGEWIWRPLTNRSSVQVTSLRDRQPRGFGLVQRSRGFDDYLDLEAEYHRRPSEWVEPLDGDWGAGGVTLVELPSPSEFNDNIVAFWAPDGGMDSGEERHFRYRLHTFDDRRVEQDVARVVRTRIGWDALPGQADPPPRDQRRVIVDFEGPSLALVDGATPIEAVVDVSAGEVVDVQVQPIPGGGRRATFSLRPDAGRPADIRLYLRGDTIVSETWSYLWRPTDGH